MNLDNILFGDNQFFGINHMSEEKARTQQMRFQSTQAITDVLDIAYQAGIRTFMCTTHDRVAEICDYFRDNVNRYPDYMFIPCMPYAHKYANAVTEHGMVEALKMALPSGGAWGAMLKGGRAIAKQDRRAVLELLIDAEMKMFEGLNTPAIFLQNVATDLALGLGAVESLRTFYDHVATEYGAEPGFITMNTPLLIDSLESVGIENPLICSNINKIGFRMSGGLAAYEEAIASRRFRPIAMSVFASGAIPADEAIEYVCGLPGIQSIVFGASSAGNIRQTAELIRGHWPEPSERQE